MIKSYLKIAVRNLLRHKAYSLINLFGLAAGIACFAIITLYVQDELSYDRFHKDADRIYRVVKDGGDADAASTHVPPALMPAIMAEIPEVEQAVRFFIPEEKVMLGYGDKAFNDGHYLYVDSTFFNVFSFSFLRGTPQTALTDPLSIVLTKSMAEKYFGNDDPIGKQLDFAYKWDPKVLRVTGVIEDVPAQSHFTVDYLLPFPSYPNWVKWTWYGGTRVINTYVKLKAGVDVAVVEGKIQDLVNRNLPENTDVYSTQPLAGLNGIYLASHRQNELGANSDKLYVEVLSLVAVLVILIAGINYVNLATARSAMRAKEIGVRKVVGAMRNSLVRQFLAESVLMSVLAGLVAIILTEMPLLFFNSIMGKHLSLFTRTNLPVWLSGGFAVLAIGSLAGLYPALYLSAFKPISVLKNLRISTKSGYSQRQALVVFQFAMAAMLIVGVIVVQKQLNFLQDTDLGFDKEQIIIVPDFLQLYGNRNIARTELAQLPGVVKVGTGRELAANSDKGWFNRPMRRMGADKEVIVERMDVDYNYLDLFGLELKSGRNFAPEFPGDRKTDTRVILNETAVRQLGLNEPVIGQNVGNWDSNSSTWSTATIIGVVEDFHFSSLHNEIRPLKFVYNPNGGLLVVKVAGSNTRETLSQIANIWDKYAWGGAPFNFYFLDSAIEQQYRSEQNFRTIFSALAGLSIVIACLGLFGLVAFTAEQRTREIGIRKVVGATAANIVTLLSGEFVKLVVVANIIAWPVAWFAMHAWLQNFAYRIDIGTGTFVLAGFSGLLIAALTVSFQAYKAAMTNPVESLSYE